MFKILRKKTTTPTTKYSLSQMKEGNQMMKDASAFTRERNRIMADLEHILQIFDGKNKGLVDYRCDCLVHYGIHTAYDIQFSGDALYQALEYFKEIKLKELKALFDEYNVEFDVEENMKECII